MQIVRDVEEEIKKWNERSMFEMRGVKNLSLSDMETIVLYAERYDGERFVGMSPPVGGVALVLDAYGLFM